MKTPLSTLTTPFRLLKKLYVAEFFVVFVIVGLLAGYFSLNAASSNRNKPLIFQGRLTDNSYVPLSDGSTAYLRFAFYDASSAGNCLWVTGTDTATGVNNCSGGSGSARGIATTVTRGIFTVALGDNTVTNMPTLPLDFNPARVFIGVTACTAADSGCDAEMTPRVRIGGSAYAYNADEIDGINSGRLFKFHDTTTGDTVASGTATSTVIRGGAYSAQDPASELVDLDLDFATNGFQFTTGGASLATQRSMLIRSRTYTASAATQTISHASTLGILGSPTVGSNIAITNSSSLRILTANVGASTNSYGLYVDAMTGATNNYAAAFATGNVGIGTDVTPNYVLELSQATGIANAFSMSADDVAHGLTALYNGTFQQQLETGTFFQAGVLNGGGAGMGGALLTGASDSDSPGMRIVGVIGTSASSTAPALYLTGARVNSTDATKGGMLSSHEILAYLSNNDTPLLTMNGSGDLGLGDVTPNGKLDLLSSSAASSTSIILTNTGGADPVINFEVAEGTASYSVGLDNDDSDRFKISTTGLGTNDLLRIDSRTNGNASTAHDIRGLNASITSGAGVDYTTLSVTPPAITLTGSTQVTSQMDSFYITSPLITDADAVTVDDAALLSISGGPTAGGSVTISDAYALKINSATVTVGGTVTRSYGLYTEALSGATTNYAAAFTGGNVGIGVTTPAVELDIDGGLSIRDSGTTQNLTADDTTITVGDRSYIKVDSDNGTASNRTFTLTQSTRSGHILMLEFVGTGTDTAEMTDDAAAGAGNLRLSATWNPTQYDTLTLISNGTDWIEISRSTN